MNNYIDAFRNSKTAEHLGKALNGYKGRKISLMEVCGTHTMSIFRYGIRQLLPESIRLISGPGCPVCVTPGYYIKSAIFLSRQRDVIITTFGDMMRIPGDGSSLLKEKALGRDVRIVYSPLDAVGIAENNPGKKVVFLSVGFETTTPVIALAVLRACEKGLGNFSILTANKTIPEVLKILLNDPEVKVDGFLYPGHVSAIIGTHLYEGLAEKFHIPGVVTGFEPADILRAISALAANINNGCAKVENFYTRVVPASGNPVAIEKMNEVFEPCDAVWRGIGSIPGSGLKVREEYSSFDSWKVFDVGSCECEEPKGCLCGEVLKGKKTPAECGLFKRVCTPENPVGACMVSSEGTCAAYYKYNLD